MNAKFLQTITGLLKGGIGNAAPLLTGMGKAELGAATATSGGKLAALGFGLGGLQFGADIGAPVVQGLRDAWGTERMKSQVETQWQGESLARWVELRRQRAEQMAGENLVRLAVADPELYARVAAGRRLPRGAVVLGGRPRTDLLEELSLRMSEGAYNTPGAQQTVGGPFDQMMR